METHMCPCTHLGRNADEYFSYRNYFWKKSAKRNVILSSHFVTLLQVCSSKESES
jgi:hypothetical protein